MVQREYSIEMKGGCFGDEDDEDDEDEEDESDKKAKRRGREKMSQR